MSQQRIAAIIAEERTEEKKRFLRESIQNFLTLTGLNQWNRQI